MQQVPAFAFWPLVLTSAAVAAVVSAAATIVGQMFERRARRRELLFEKAFQLASVLRDEALRASGSGRKVQVQDDIVTAETYYKWLQVLWDTGALPDDPRIKRVSRDDPQS
jgi:hypothetical protein